MHLHYFSQDSMANMLNELGYEVIKSGTQGRYLRLGYLASRVGGINHTLGKVSSATTGKLGLEGTAVPVNFGDLFTVYARRPGGSSE
jgi:hypothetical protein